MTLEESVDDTAAVAQPPGRHAQRVEGASQVGGDRPVEQRVAALRDPRQVHGAGGVDQDVGAAERRLGGVEQADHRRRIGHVGPDRDGLTTTTCELHPAHQRLGRRDVADVADDDGVALVHQALRDGRADAARGAPHDRGLSGMRVHRCFSFSTAGFRRNEAEGASFELRDHRADVGHSLR